MRSVVKPYVFRVKPFLSEKVWGGSKLVGRYGKNAGGDVLLGESWEVADLPEGQSLVDGGVFAGETLGAVTARWGRELVGTRAVTGGGGDAFPLLVKILDAQDDLSIQVHPGPDNCGLFEGARSKDECWLVLDVEPGASVLHGFSRATDAEEFGRAVEAGNVVELLRRVEVQPGDLLRVEPGTVHAICSGVVLLEVQEPSDTTYRVYDYGRPGLDGLPRALHLEQALAVTDWGAVGPAKLASVSKEKLAGGHELEVLVDAGVYRMERLRVVSELDWRVDRGSVQIVFVVSGACEVLALGGALGAESEAVELVAGQTAVIPACSGRVRVRAKDGGAELVVSGLGGQALVDVELVVSGVGGGVLVDVEA